jgi:hypothetical protein
LSIAAFSPHQEVEKQGDISISFSLYEALHRYVV